MMKNRNSMIGIVMLEAMWQNQKKDMISLIQPFVLSIVSKTTKINNIINVQNIQKVLQDKYGYIDIPQAVIIKALKKSKIYITCKRSNFIYTEKYDSEDQQIDKREEECQRRIEELSKNIAEYLDNHCKRHKKYSPLEVEEYLGQFFSQFGLELGFGELATTNISQRNNEELYYISQYILECKNNGGLDYKNILKLVKGFYLRQAIYNSSDTILKSFENVTFVYDTPCLINILGYSTKEYSSESILLHETLKKHGARFGYFPSIRNELDGVLHAYKNSLIYMTNTARTLDGLDEKNYSPSLVDDELIMLDGKLSNHKIYEVDIPHYDQKQDGTVEEREVLDEAAIKNSIKNQATGAYASVNLETDVESVVSIIRLRKNRRPSNITNARYILVTSNVDFAKGADNYFRNINQYSFPPVITDSDLAAITWVIDGGKTDLPETDLLRNAYSLMSMPSDLLEEMEEIFNQLCSEGSITPETVSALRANRTFQSELYKDSFGENNNKLESRTVLNEINRYNNNIIEPTRHQLEIVSAENERLKEEKKEEKKRSEQKHKELANNCNRKAAEYAKLKREKYEKNIKIIVVLTQLFFIFIFGTEMVNELKTTITKCEKPTMKLVVSIVIVIFCFIGEIQTLKSNDGYIKRLISKHASAYETRIKEKKLIEYINLYRSEFKEKSQ